MPEYLAPGVYVEEVSSGNKPIAGVSTSTAGFVGGTERGPLAPQFITSWLEFQRWYGGYTESSYLAYAIEGFFTNGGQRCFVARVVRNGATIAKTTYDSTLNIVAIGPGKWGDSVGIVVEEASLAKDLVPQNPREEAIKRWVKITVNFGTINEVYDNLTLELGKSNNIATTINAASRLVRVWLEDGLQPDAQLTHSPMTDVQNEQDPGAAPLKAPELEKLKGGLDGAAPLVREDFKGNQDPIDVPKPGQTDPPAELLSRGVGLSALELVDEVSLLVVPDQAHDDQYQVLTGVVIEQCERLKDRFAIVSAPLGKSSINDLRPPLDTTYAGFYYPWIKVYDPLTNYSKKVPCVGHVAGIFARTDIERGVHKAPANEVVRGALDLEFPVTKTMQDILNPRGVNCMRDFRSDGRGLRLWGARTMSSDPEWRYVNVRRLFLFVEESIDEGTQWVVFEPNDDSTWAKVRRNITNFLISVWRSGALMGLTADEAFFVACDRTTMTQDDIDNGRLICVIGIAPVKPAEFIIFRISQKTSDSAG
ncbi:MAG: phage tail sheath family protein [Chloroflexota bacterium]